jgi:hypothetical integral membrane protein (TIGR02206 family)
MRRVAVGIAIVLTALIIILDIRGLLSMWKPVGLQVHTPSPQYIQPLEIPLGGLAWIKDGNPVLQASLLKEGSGEVLAVQTIYRDRVMYKGQLLYELAGFRSRITAPESGRYLLRIVLLDASGLSRAQVERSLTVSAAAPDTEFRMFSISHLIALAVLFLLAITVYVLGRSKNVSQEIKLFLAVVMFTIMLVNEVVYHIYWQSVGAWSVSTALMIQMCGLSILLLPWVFMLKPGAFSQVLFEVVYFWGLGGALQALLTPDIGLLGFPSYKYFSFFISHGLIILLVIYASVSLPYKISLKSLVRVMILSNVVVLCVYFINMALVFLPPYEVGNYFVLSYPPVTGSLVDLFVTWFGPSPWYFIGFELMALVVFTILVLPWRKHDTP